MDLAAQEWLEKNTIKCPLGRVTDEQCEKLRKRPTVDEILALKRKANLGIFVPKGADRLVRPSVCTDCKLYEKRLAMKERKEREVKRTKICTKCKKQLPIDEFYRDAKSADGYKSQCKKCSKGIVGSCWLCGTNISQGKERKIKDKTLCFWCFDWFEKLLECPDMVSRLFEILDTEPIAGSVESGRRGRDMDGYESLEHIFDLALDRAAKGKGRERHANGEPFERQPICQIQREVGIGFGLGQARKKILESTRLEKHRARDELLDAINYLASTIIVIEEQGEEIRDCR